MVVVVTVKKVHTRPGLLQRDSGSLTTMQVDVGKSASSSSLKSNSSRENRSRRSVCFASDYNVQDQIVPSPIESLSEAEMQRCFYSKAELEKFDKDRALTILLYTTRKNNGVPWDDNVHSLRGLEEVLLQRKNEKSRRRRRSEHVQAVLQEQDKFRSEEGKQELIAAAKSIKKSESDLYAELIRGVSCSHSKADKARALALAQKDEKASGAASNSGSARKLLHKVKSKITVWASTSSRSLGDRSIRSEKSEKDEE